MIWIPKFELQFNINSYLKCGLTLCLIRSTSIPYVSKTSSTILKLFSPSITESRNVRKSLIWGSKGVKSFMDLTARFSSSAPAKRTLTSSSSRSFSIMLSSIAPYSNQPKNKKNIYNPLNWLGIYVHSEPNLKISFVKLVWIWSYWW